MRFDGDASLAFQVHVVQDLVLHIALADGTGSLKKSIGQCRFSVVDMGDYAKISNVFHQLGLA
jgi:hypothetical protein